MDNIPIFCPNIPPPPIHLQYAPSPLSSSKADQNSNLYKERLQNYLQTHTNSNRCQISNDIGQKPLKLSEVAMNLSQYYATIETIKAKIDNITEEATSMNSDHWNNQMAMLTTQLEHLSSINQKYQNSNTCQAAKRLVEKRRQKRDRIKKRKLELDTLEQYEMERRQLKHQQIDQCLQKSAENHQKHLFYRANKQRAERVLNEVNRLKNDAAKYLRTFDLLIELHRIRSRDSASTAAESVEFSREIDNLKTMWLDALVKYETEEKRLRAFLDCSDHWQSWQETLFDDVTTDDDLFSLKKNENGLEKLLDIRRQWDSFIVSHANSYGSSVPLGWAMPNANPTNEWKIYLK